MDLDKMFEESKKIDIKLETLGKVISFYHDYFEGLINDIIRRYSIYEHLFKINKNSSVALDYYDLTLINLRTIFAPKMPTKINKEEINRDKYHLSFIQWVYYFYAAFSKYDLNNSFTKSNKKNLNKTLLELKKNLQKFEYIYNDKKIDNNSPITLFPLKTRIHNYASKYVAHRVPEGEVLKWQYSNGIFISFEELNAIVSLISKIEDSYRNVLYYWSNVYEMPEIKYLEKLEVKTNKHFNKFIEEIKCNKST